MLPSQVLATQVIEPEWIVEGMLPRGTMAILAGEAGAGKSFLSYTLAYCAAAGLPFLGMPSKPTRVLYFDEENGEPDFLQYNQWIWMALGQPDLALLDQNLRLEHHSLVSGWKQVMWDAIRDHKPGLVVIDTCTPAFQLQDENDNAEAVQVLNILRDIRARVDRHMTFLLLKHERQRDDQSHKRTIRGAKSWLGACDQVLYHVIPRGARRRKDGLRRTHLEPDKMRAFSLRSTIGIDPAWTETTPKGLILHGKALGEESEKLLANS